MYLYFFDLDDTICDTNSIIEEFIKKYSIDKDKMDKNEFYEKAGEYIRDYGLHNIDPLHNSTLILLKDLIEHSKKDIYYITARPSSDKEQSVLWLKKHNLWLGENKLIMDTEGIKGKTINQMMENKYKDKKFAFLFDDLDDNHKEASKYKNIISCLPY